MIYLKYDLKQTYIDNIKAILIILMVCLLYSYVYGLIVKCGWPSNLTIYLVLLVIALSFPVFLLCFHWIYVSIRYSASPSVLW